MKKKLVGMIVVIMFLIPSSMASENAVLIEEVTTVKTNSEPINHTFFAYIFGRIENLRENQQEITFDAVNVYVVSIIIPGFYYLNSGEEIQIDCIMDDVFPIFGIMTDNFIFAFTSPTW